ncbi:MAG: tetraacyldisaccharide 4'-kinase [PVC group bacterium]|nr:tetraacyldisaccharide 4'-kinase [PVC group bacterium]
MAVSVKERIKKYLLAVNASTEKDLKGTLVRGFLFVLSCVYGIVLKLRLFFYKRGIFGTKRFKAKVISVGNITVGGTGKTPLAATIVAYLLSKECKPAVVTRGYTPEQAGVGKKPDEPLMLKKEFPEVPIIISPDRVSGIREAEKKHNAGCVVLDDAFGNLKVFKDLNIVCIDCTNPFGNEMVLPRGIMRLPFIYLKQADVFVLTNADFNKLAVPEIAKKLQIFNEEAMICQGVHAPQYFYDLRKGDKKELASIKGKRTALLSGLGNPDNFTRTVGKCGAEVVVKLRYPDHYKYTAEDIDKCIQICRDQKVEVLVVTAKDEVKLQEAFQSCVTEFDVLVLKIKMEIVENEERFFTILSNIYST